MPVHPDVPNLFGLHQFDGYAAHPAASIWVQIGCLRCSPLSSVCSHAAQIAGIRALRDFRVSASLQGCRCSVQPKFAVRSAQSCFDCRATSFFAGMPPLSEGAGYAVVVGFGAFFSIFTTILVFLDYRFGGTKQTSEQVWISSRQALPSHYGTSRHCTSQCLVHA